MKNLQLTKFETITRYLLICLFLYAAITKGMEFQKFQVQLSSSPLVPVILVKTTAILVISMELIIVGFLSVSALYLSGLLLSYSLMLFFSLYVFYLLNVPEFIPCACGGILGKMGHETHLFFNLAITFLSIISIYIFITRTKKHSIDKN